MSMEVTGVDLVDGDEVVLKITDSLGTEGEVTLPIEQEKTLRYVLWKRAKDRQEEDGS